MEGGEELELTLGRNWVGQRYLPDLNVEDPELNIRFNFGVFSTYSLRDEVEETEKRVCTRLDLCCAFDQWVEKLLGYYDIRQRFCLRKPWIERKVLPTMSQQAQQAMQQVHHTIVEVYDTDTQSTHHVMLSRQEGFFLRGAWVREFVLRRKLISQDTIGLYWEAGKQRFLFRVLKRAPRTEEQLLASELFP